MYTSSSKPAISWCDGIRPDNQGIETHHAPRAARLAGDGDGIRPDNQGIETTKAGTKCEPHPS